MPRWPVPIVTLVLKETDPAAKQALLLHYVGSPVHQIFKTLHGTGNSDDYDKAKLALTKYLKSYTSTDFEQ